MPCIFTVDVEDWFHILDVPSAPPLSQWDSLPSRVEKNFLRLLDIFSEHNAHVTCFFLGWVAAKFPHLVKEAVQHGHEVASHGYAHRLVYEMTPAEFLEDARRAKDVIEQCGGRKVLGYRSSGFSVTEKTPWFFSKLIEAGYVYDSSVFPVSRGHGGLNGAPLAPYLIQSPQGSLTEFPMTVTKVMGKPMCFFGGGYLRIFPYSVIKHMADRVAHEGRPVIFYIHPREVDPGHPRLPMGLIRRFKSYVNLESSERKVRRLIGEHTITTLGEFLAENPIHSGN